MTIYIITDELDELTPQRLVEARSQAHAKAYVTRERFSAVVAKAGDVARLMNDGTVLETAEATVTPEDIAPAA